MINDHWRLHDCERGWGLSQSMKGSGNPILNQRLCGWSTGGWVDGIPVIGWLAMSSHILGWSLLTAIDRSNDFAWSLHTEDMIHQLVDCEHPIRIPLSTVFPTIYIYVSQKILPWVTFDIHGYPICPMIIPYLFPYHCWCSQLGAPSPPIFRRTLRHHPPWQCLRPGDPGGPRGDPGIDVVHVVELWVEELGWLVIMVMKQGIRWLLTYC